ncbi:hypothetical protein HBI38_106870 [Parastagonospora nodorum]|nr:hypothetical protein HBH51_084160 [Parastagonospora nodorum]KAH4054803.1 hypothetical protein HBH49_067480 [Parastagonospora nodorum]KAH4175879.1 hypothetical protein HBH43_068220 [Parastagonospora nodorum]KAH4212553.1 hypothetical protein HBI95_038910 [Parastagonospora nodorum]KAH4231619.1 hypothetical protein HBI06_074740 [Parastagonospora nodorum]
MIPPPGDGYLSVCVHDVLHIPRICDIYIYILVACSSRVNNVRWPTSPLAAADSRLNLQYHYHQEVFSRKIWSVHFGC